MQMCAVMRSSNHQTLAVHGDSEGFGAQKTIARTISRMA